MATKFGFVLDCWTGAELSRRQARDWCTHTETDVGKDNTQRPKLASGKNESRNVNTDQLISPYLTLGTLMTSAAADVINHNGRKIGQFKPRRFG